MSKIIVTGGAGFLGAHLVPALEALGHDVYNVDNLSGGYMRNVKNKEKFTKLDLRNRIETEAYINKIRPEIIFHLAADATEGRSQFTPFSAIDNNLVAYMNLLVPAINCGLKKMVMCSCHDEKTRLVTDKGIKNFKDITKDDIVFTLNTNTGLLEKQKINEIIINDYNGEMISFKGRADLCVTPNHRMLYIKSPNLSPRLEFEEASVSSKRAFLKLPVAKWINGVDDENFILKDNNFRCKKQPTTIKKKDLMYLIGLFIADGVITSSTNIRSSKTGLDFKTYIKKNRDETGKFFKNIVGVKDKEQSTCFHEVIRFCVPEKDKARKKLEKVLTRNNFDYSKYSTEIRLVSNGLSSIFSGCGKGAFNKDIPKWCLEEGKIYLEELFNGLIDGDGHWRSFGGGLLATVSYGLVQSCIELAVKLGKTMSFKYHKRKTAPMIKGRVIGGEGAYYVYFAATEPSLWKRGIKKSVYSGKVWCLNVDNGNFLVERNGKICFSGNSMSIYGAQRPPFTEEMDPKPEDVYASAKASMETVTKVLGSVHGFEYVIMRPHNCYDDKTEVLTNNGFKVFRDLKKEDLIATLNPNTNFLEYHKAYDWQKIKYKGKLINFKSKSHDLMVTPDHKMYIKKTPKSGYSFLEANNFLDNNKKLYYSRIKNYVDGWVGEDKPYYVIDELKDKKGRKMTNCHQNGYRKVIPMELWCRFLGWYISEGCRFITPRNYVINISQYKNIHPKNFDEIVEIIKKMGFNPYLHKNGKDILIFSKQLYLELDKIGIKKGSHNVNIPIEIKNLDKKYLVPLFESLMKGDGDSNGHRYSTVSPVLADDFVELCLKISKSVYRCKEINKDGKEIYRLAVSDKNEIQLGDNRTKEVFVKEVDYNGYVYDVTVPNHIIFVRRNGKASWSSNCYGRHQNLADPYRNVIGIFINRLLNGKPFYIYGDGKQTRAFSHVNDVVPNMVMAGFKKECVGKVINIGGEVPYEINELADIILEEFFDGNVPNEFKPLYLPGRPKEVKHAFCDHTLARNLINFEQSVSLGDGIRDMVQWARGIGPQEFVYLDKLDIENEKTPRSWTDRLF